LCTTVTTDAGEGTNTSRDATSVALPPADRGCQAVAIAWPRTAAAADPPDDFLAMPSSAANALRMRTN
jgi:hypothetical protein